MKLKHLTILLGLVFYCPSFSQPGDSGGNGPIDGSVSIDNTFLEVSLFQGDKLNKTLTILNDTDDDLSLSLSLSSTSHDTELHEKFLIAPRIFSVDDYFGSSADERNPLTGSGITQIVLPENARGLAGLAFDGEFLYYSTSSKPGTIYKLIPQFKNNVVDSLYAPILATVRISGLTYSGSFLYATSVDTNLIYQISLQTGELIDQIAMDGNGLGVAFGGNRGTLFAITSNTEIIEINPATKEIINRLPSPKKSKGLAYSNGLERLFVGEEFNLVYGINPDDGSIINSYEDFTAALTADETFGLKWLDFPYVTINAPAKSPVEYVVSFDASDLEPGVYKTTIEFALNDDENSTIKLPVELEVLPVVGDIIVESFCSVASSDENIWKIQNPNDFAVDAKWNILTTDLQGNLELQPGENILFTDIVDGIDNILQIEWLNERGIQQETTVTSNNTICDLRGLTAQAICTENRDAIRQWEIANPNLFPVAVEWEVLGTDMKGSLELQNGINLLSTAVNSADESYTLQIIWYTETGDIKRQRKISSNTPCDLRGLTLTPACTDDPDLRKRWEVFNPNAFIVQLTWELGGSDLADNISVPPGISYFYSTTEPDVQVMKIIWQDEEGNFRRQQKSSDLGACTDANTFARNNSEPLQEELEMLGEVLAVYPNPFQDKLSINVPSLQEENDKWTITIYNMLGTKVYEHSVETAQNDLNIEVNTSHLSKGTYIMMLNMRNIQRRATLIKQ